MCKLYKIGEFSKMTKTSVKTLRYYDEVGILKPAYVDKNNNYRYYTTKQLIPLSKIVSLRQMGISIDDVFNIMSGNDVKNILKQKEQELKREISYISEKLARINWILENKEAFFMDYQVTIKDLPNCIVFYKQGVVSTTSEYGNFINKAIEEFKISNPNLINNNNDGYCYTKYLDKEFTNKNVSVEYASEVRDFGKETQNIKFKRLKSVKAACIYHKGRYENIGESFSYLYKWIEANGYTPCEGAREYYIDGPWNGTDEENYLTEIQIPIIKLD